MAEAASGRGGGAVSTVGGALACAEERDELGAFWAMDAEGALRQATELDRAADGGGPLAGIPVAVKDLFDLAGLPTTAGLPGSWPRADADAGLVRRLRSAGAVPIGKTAMDPLGLTTGGQAPGFPPCRNPIDSGLSPRRVLFRCSGCGRGGNHSARARQ